LFLVACVRPVQARVNASSAFAVLALTECDPCTEDDDSYVVAWRKATVGLCVRVFMGWGGARVRRPSGCSAMERGLVVYVQGPRMCAGRWMMEGDEECGGGAGGAGWRPFRFARRQRHALG